MSAEHDNTRLDSVTQRWHNLAARRLAYFTELYRSGRWQQYYVREHFALLMLDVIRVERAWRELAGRPTPEQPAMQPEDLRPAA